MSADRYRLSTNHRPPSPCFRRAKQSSDGLWHIEGDPNPDDLFDQGDEGLRCAASFSVRLQRADVPRRQSSRHVRL